MFYHSLVVLSGLFLLVHTSETGGGETASQDCVEATGTSATRAFDAEFDSVLLDRFATGFEVSP